MARRYGSGYQLTQSLIAFGRGHWLGLGFGDSVQKLFYLPEAHTDFIIAIISEEFGFLGDPVKSLGCRSRQLNPGILFCKTIYGGIVKGPGVVEHWVGDISGSTV